MRGSVLVLSLFLLATAAEAQVGSVRRIAPPQGGAGAGGTFGRDSAARVAPATPNTPSVPLASTANSFSQHLYAPELVMRNQAAITLQDGQRARIMSEMTQAQSRFTELQWTLSLEEEKLNNLLQQPAPAEQAVLAQMERVLDVEQNLKRTQLSLLVRIKNVLTPEQQGTLTRLRGGPGSGGTVNAVRRTPGGER